MKNTETAAITHPVSDLYLTAFLLCKGMELIRTERATSSRVIFIFKDIPRRAQLVQNFYGRKEKVDPLAYKDAIVNLKSLIHGMKSESMSKTKETAS